MTRAPRLFARLAAAVLATAAVGLVDVATAPGAAAATCSTGAGVSVVVDPGSLGGGVQSGCIAGGAGRTASSLFASAGFDLAYVQNEPGFVCRVNQRPSPSEEPCVNTPPEDAYWGLWWSDGTSGSWVYSNYGVGSLKVPDGGYVALAWQSGSKTPPGVAPAVHAAPAPTTATASATPTSRPSTKPSSKPSSKPTHKASSTPSSKPSSAPTSGSAPTSSGASSESAAASSSAPDQTGTASASPTASPSDATASTLAEASSEATGVTSPEGSETPDPSATAGEASAVDEPAGLPTWVAPLVLVLLAAAGGAAYLLRRRRRPSP